jgi:hypothetical protein
MYKGSKGIIYKAATGLDLFLLEEKEKGNISDDEYGWLNDFIINIINSTSNFDDIDEEGYYGKELEA